MTYSQPAAGPGERWCSSVQRQETTGVPALGSQEGGNPFTPGRYSGLRLIG